MTETTVIAPSEERIAQANGIEIAYQTFGDEADPPMLLIMGLGTQMVGWDEEFCGLLASHGFYVIRFDNRDVGHSTKLRDAGRPSVAKTILASVFWAKVKAPYLLSDMAKDAAGLIEALGNGAAHIVGVSMGGMIAQQVAIDFPERVRTLTSIMSSTGYWRLPRATPKAFLNLFRHPGKTKEEFIERAYKLVDAIGGELPQDREKTLKRASQTWDRGIYPAGFLRQMSAILGSGDRRKTLAKVSAPSLVIHGDCDPLVKLEHGRDTANHLPGAKFEIVKGMGHGLPPSVWPTLIEAIVDHARAANWD
mgnify:CR=1 FL=1